MNAEAEAAILRLVEYIDSGHPVTVTEIISDLDADELGALLNAAVVMLARDGGGLGG